MGSSLLKTRWKNGNEKMKKEERVAYDAKYYQKNKERIAKRDVKNKKKIAKRKAKYYKEKYPENRETITKRRRELYIENKTNILEQRAKYYRENREAILKQNAKYLQENKEKIKAQRVKYRKSPSCKMLRAKYQLKRKRRLGFIPLNEYFEGSNGHHINSNIVICIPAEMHQSVCHRLTSGQGMQKINALSFSFLAEQRLTEKAK